MLTNVSDGLRSVGFDSEDEGDEGRNYTARNTPWTSKRLTAAGRKTALKLNFIHNLSENLEPNKKSPRVLNLSSSSKADSQRAKSGQVVNHASFANSFMNASTHGDGTTRIQRNFTECKQCITVKVLYIDSSGNTQSGDLTSSGKFTATTSHHRSHVSILLVLFEFSCFCEFSFTETANMTE